MIFVSRDAFKATQEQASAWAEIDVVQRFRSELPRNRAKTGGSSVNSRLQELQAMAGSALHHPLTFGSTVPFVDGQVPRLGGGDKHDNVRDWEQWLAAASRVELAHRWTVAWMRSRLPRYPNFQLPHIARESSIRTMEYTPRLVWGSDHLGSKLQFLGNPPAVVTEALAITAAQATRVTEAARSMASALERDSRWAEFKESADAVSASPRAIDALRSVTRRYRAALDRLDSFEMHRALRRFQYREFMLRECVTRLSGAARRYADSFEAVNNAIDLVASEIFAEALCYPSTFVRAIRASPRRLEGWTENEKRFLEIEFADEPFDLPSLGGLYTVSIDGIGQLIRCEGTSFSFGRTFAQTITGQVLADTDSLGL